MQEGPRQADSTQGGTWAQAGPRNNTPSAWLSPEPTGNKIEGQAGENRTVTLVTTKSRAEGNGTGRGSGIRQPRLPAKRETQRRAGVLP